MNEKNKYWISILTGFLLVLTYGYEKDDTNIRAFTATDIDGNIYHTVTIGTQVWMVENLKVTRYNDGTAILHVIDNEDWKGLTKGAFCNYDNNHSYVSNYGRLYNWHAVATGKLAPTGWHVPTYAELKSLSEYLGGTDVAGGKMKERGTAHWKSPNTGATNETGFSALPGGTRASDGVFSTMGYYALFWTSTEFVYNYAWTWQLLSSSEYMHLSNNHDKSHGFSIRCVMD